MITLGCDPEFVMIDQEGNLVCSEPMLIRLSPHFCRRIGRDGGGKGYIWELRPRPSTDPREVVEEIRYLFSRIAIHCPETLQYTWLAGNSVKSFPLGGHIHFGVPPEKKMVMVCFYALCSSLPIRAVRKPHLSYRVGMEVLLV